MISTVAELTAALKSLSYVDWIRIGEFLYQIGESLLGLPDPMTEFLSLFAGRPTMAATVDTARVLKEYSSPALQLLAAGAANSLAHGVPLSSSEGDPYFGPYFVAARQIEEGIRWSRSDPSTQAVETNTLAVAMGEAGNPGVRGDATILAIQTAWNLLKSGRPQGGSSPREYFQQKADNQNQDKTSGLVRGWSQTWIEHQPHPPPPPPHRPPPPPPPQPPPSQPTLSFSVAQNSTFHGDFPVTVTVTGGTFPEAQLYVDREGEIIFTFPAGTTSNTEQLPIPLTVPTQNLLDGTHTIEAYWRGQRGDNHAQGILHWHLQRQSPTPVDPCTITFNFHDGQTINTSPVALIATVKGGPHPQARLLWSFGNHAIANIAAPTTSGTTPQIYTASWTSTPFVGQSGQITASWDHAAGGVICQVSASITIAAAHPQPQPSPTPCVITFNYTNGDEFQPELLPLRATVKGGPHPQAKLVWTYGYHQLATLAAPTTDGTTPETYESQWDSTPYNHTVGLIKATWEHADGEVICSVSATIGIGANPGHPTPTPPPSPSPQPPPTTWQQCCKEIVDALTMIADALGSSAESAGMKALVEAVKEIVAELGKTGSIPDTLAKIHSQQVKHDEGELASKALLDKLVNIGLMDAEVGQLLGDPYPVTIHPNPIPPVIAKWLRGDGIDVKDADRSWAHAIIRWVKALLEWIEKETTPFFKDAVKDLAPWVKGIEESFGTLFTEFAHLDTTLPVHIFQWVTETITKNKGITPDNVETVAFDLFGGAFLVGQAVHILKEFVGFLKYPVSSVWKENAELLVEMLAYKEILHSFHNAFYSTAITVRAKQKYQREYRPHIPSYSEGHHAFARGKLDANGRNGLDGLNGLDPAYTGFMQSLAYRPIPARMLVQGFRNNAPPSDLLQQVITDQGVDPRFHHLVEQIIDDACYQHLFDTYTSASLQACAQGAMTLQDLDDNLKASNWDVKARNIARQIALIQRQEQIAKQAETAAQTELAGGFITEAQARALMEGAGIDSWRVDTVTAIANARAALTAERRIQTEEQRQLKAGLAAAFKGLAAQFTAGELSEVALIAGLEAVLEVYLVEYQAAGATPQEIAAAARFGEAEILALVAQAKAKLDGAQVLKYGKLMSREQAQLLDAQVAALHERVIRLDESIPNASNALHALGLPQQFVQALIARWDAQIQAKGALA